MKIISKCQEPSTDLLKLFSVENGIIFHYLNEIDVISLWVCCRSFQIGLQVPVLEIFQKSLHSSSEIDFSSCALRSEDSVFCQDFFPAFVKEHRIDLAPPSAIPQQQKLKKKQQPLFHLLVKNYISNPPFVLKSIARVLFLLLCSDVNDSFEVKETEILALMKDWKKIRQKLLENNWSGETELNDLLIQFSRQNIPTPMLTLHQMMRISKIWTFFLKSEYFEKKKIMRINSDLWVFVVKVHFIVSFFQMKYILPNNVTQCLSQCVRLQKQQQKGISSDNDSSHEFLKEKYEEMQKLQQDLMSLINNNTFTIATTATTATSVEESKTKPKSYSQLHGTAAPSSSSKARDRRTSLSTPITKVAKKKPLPSYSTERHEKIVAKPAVPIQQASKVNRRASLKCQSSNGPSVANKRSSMSASPSIAELRKKISGIENLNTSLKQELKLQKEENQKKNIEFLNLQHTNKGLQDDLSTKSFEIEKLRECQQRMDELSIENRRLEELIQMKGSDLEAVVLTNNKLIQETSQLKKEKDDLVNKTITPIEKKLGMIHTENELLLQAKENKIEQLLDEKTSYAEKIITLEKRVKAFNEEKMELEEKIEQANGLNQVLQEKVQSFQKEIAKERRMSIGFQEAYKLQKNDASPIPPSPPSPPVPTVKKKMMDDYAGIDQDDNEQQTF